MTDSGPFCRHWSDPSTCDDACGRCGHLCCDHGQFIDHNECYITGCTCTTWREDDEPEPGGLAAMREALEDNAEAD